MNSRDFTEIVTRATESTLKSELQSILSNGQVGDVLHMVGFLRKKLYVYIDPHFIRGSLYLRLASNDATVRGTLLADFNGFAGKEIGMAVFELHRNGRAYELAADGFDPVAESHDALIYEYSAGGDIFWIKGTRYVVPATDPLADSQFCGRTFYDLQSALSDYARVYALPCKCPVLQSAWHDGRRLYFRAKPEEILRDSLKHFLDVRLAAGYEVRAEQNMDDSHPTDIKVSKQLQPRLMIIEIKWLGDSMNESGTASNVSYRDARAIEGVHQLASYLDANRVEAPHLSSVGYYVILDGRRKGLSVGKVDYDVSDLLHYENQDIEFGDLSELKRPDFTSPLRMFIRPVTGAVGSQAGPR
jgi:hypothetical protein